MKSTGTLTIQTHDLGKGLGNDHLEALIDEKAQSEGISVKGTGSEALIGGIEERIELSAFANFSNLTPLCLSGVDTGGVVGASVEEDAGTWCSSIQVSKHAVDIKSLGCLVEVSVLTDIDASTGEDLVMVAPGWVAHVQGGGLELGQELADDTQGTSSGESLDGGDVLGSDPWAVPTEDDTLGALAEFSEAVDGKVLLVERVISDDGSLGLAHDWENEGLAVVVTVCAHTQVDLLWVLVSLVPCREGQDCIGWCLLHVLELVVQGVESLHEWMRFLLLLSLPLLLIPTIHEFILSGKSDTSRQ